ncbi:MAG TPA: ABC transporter substrate-binding protein [Longimicrobiales bacterium]|nr:ABC transporter substrate-binding protein [Longimicrobiales bacterium]
MGGRRLGLRSTALAIVWTCATLLGGCGERSGDRSFDGATSTDDLKTVTLLYPDDDLGPNASGSIQYLVFLTLMRRLPSGVVRRGSSPLVELRAENVDAVASLPDSDIPKLRNDARFELHHAYNAGSVSAILWNHDRPPFDDPRVRRALTLAIDRRAILEFLSAPAGLEPVDVLFSELQFRTGRLPPGLPHDPDAARALLEASGWVDRDGEAVREREGRPFRFSLLVSRGSGPWFPDHGREAVLVQANLQEVGVAAEILEVDAGIARERTLRKDFDAAILDIKGGNRPRVFGPEGIIGYRNPRATALIDAATKTIDRETRAELFGELGAVLRRDLPFTVLSPMVSWSAADRRLRGLSSPWRADPAWYMDALWWEDEVKPKTPTTEQTSGCHGAEPTDARAPAPRDCFPLARNGSHRVRRDGRPVRGPDVHPRGPRQGPRRVDVLPEPGRRADVPGVSPARPSGADRRDRGPADPQLGAVG